MVHKEIQKTMDLIVEDAGMHHTNMVRGVVAGLQKILKQEKYHTENVTIIPVPINHVANAVQSNQKKLGIQLQRMQAMTKTIQMQYAASLQHNHQ